jgi:hypothetical protein
MGDLVLKGATSGQITVTPTAIAGTNTLTLPARTGNIITSADSGTVTGTMLASATVAQSNLATNVAGNGPAFSAYQSSAQTIPATTWTKISLQTKQFDTNTNFDATTNYRFTPTVAGYYFMNGCVAPTGTSAALISAIYKNGSEAKQGSANAPPAAISANSIVSGLIYLNGSTDYVELWIYMSASVALQATSSTTSFAGFLARSA